MIIGGGDLNRHVGDMILNKPHGDMKYKKNIDIIINSHVREIRRICRSFSCFVVNNLQIGSRELDGGFTYYKHNRKSQNDILLANNKGIASILDFKIQRIGWNPSDHLPISVNVELFLKRENFGIQTSNDILDDQNVDIKKPKKINPILVNWNTYSMIIENDIHSYEHTFKNLGTSKKQRNLDFAVTSISKSLYQAATLASAHKKTENLQQVAQNRIFERANEIFRNYQHENANIDDWETVRQQAIDYLKNHSNAQEREKWSKALIENDSKYLWDKIDWKGSFSTAKISSRPSLTELTQHFQAKGKSTEKSTLLSDVNRNNYVSVLDDEITIQEINDATNKIKEDKCSGDGWVKKMITNLPSKGKTH